jgi:hypothetical protein
MGTEVFTPESPKEEKLSPTEEKLMDLLESGEITELQAHDFLVRDTITNRGVHALEPDEVIYAYELGYLEDDAVDSYIDRAENPVGFYLKDTGKGVLHGAMNVAQDATEFLNPLIGWLDAAAVETDPFTEDAFEKPEGMTDEDWQAMEDFKPETETAIGSLAEMGTEFGLYLIGPMRVAKGIKNTSLFARLATHSKTGRIAANFMVNNIAFWGAEQLAFDPHEERFSDWIDDKWKNPVTTYLKSDPEDSEAEARFKMFLEAAVLDGVFEGLALPIFKAFKSHRARLRAHAGDNVATLVDDLADGTKPSALVEDVGSKVLKSHHVDDLYPIPKTMEKAEQIIKPKISLGHNVATEVADDLIRVAKGWDEGTTESILLNMEKLDTTDKVKEVMNVMAERMIKEGDDIKMTRGVQTFEDTSKNAKKVERRIKKSAVRIADATGSHADEVFAQVTRHEMAQTFDGLRQLEARMIAYEKFMVGYDQVLTKVAAEATTDADFLKVKEMMTFAYELQGLAKGISTEIARALSARRMMRQATRFDFTKVPEEMMESAMKAEGDKLRKMVKTFSKMKGDKMTQRAFFLRKMIKPKWWQHAVELRQAALVSSPVTQARNIVGTGTAMLWDTAATLLAMSGRSLLARDMAHMRKLTSLVAGYLEGFKSALRVSGADLEKLTQLKFREFGKSLRKQIEQGRGADLGTFWQSLFTGMPVTDYMVKHDPYALGGILGGTKKALTLPFHGLTAADEFFKSMAFHGRMRQKALADALDNGFASAKARGWNKKQMMDWVDNKTSRALADPSPELLDEGINFSRDVTFTSALPTGLREINAFLNNNPLGGAIKFAFVPFFSVTANIIKFSAYRTPLGAISKRWRETLMGKHGVDAAMELGAKVAIGTGIMAWAYDMYRDGRITGAAPKDQRHAWRNANVGEYSYYSKGKWTSYTTLEPVSTLIGAAADLGRLMDDYQVNDRDFNERAVQLLMLFSENVANKTFMKGFSDFMKLFTDPERMNPERYAQNVASTSVPYSIALQTLQRATDDYRRDMRRWKDTIYKNFSSGKMFPLRHTVYGHPLRNEPRAFGQLNVRTETEDPALWDMLMVGANIAPPRRKRTIAGQEHEMTPSEYDAFLSIYEKLATMPGGLKEVLNIIVANPSWQKGNNDDFKADTYSKIITRYREIAFSLWKSGRMDLMETYLPQLQSQALAIAGIGEHRNESTATYRFNHR